MKKIVIYYLNEMDRLSRKGGWKKCVTRDIKNSIETGYDITEMNLIKQ